MIRRGPWPIAALILTVLAIASLLAGVMRWRTESALQEWDSTKMRVGVLTALVSGLDLERVESAIHCVGASGNRTNLGNEVLFIALTEGDMMGMFRSSWIGNTDSDSGQVNGRNTSLCEFVDEWRNPLAVFFSPDHWPVQGKPEGQVLMLNGRVVTVDPPELPLEAKSHQTVILVSAGQDGRFATEDDLVSWGFIVGSDPL